VLSVIMSTTRHLPYLGLQECRRLVPLVKSLLAELVGTLMLVFVGCGSCVGGSEASLSDQANIVRISLCFGLTVATLAASIGHVSGCHVNPAVTVGLVAGGKVGAVKGCLYMISQCVGAILGSYVLHIFLYHSKDVRGAAALGATTITPGVSPGQGCVIELVLGLVLVLVVFAAAGDQVNARDVKGSPPLAIGLAITACHLFAIPLTGSSMNPARSLGPAVVLGDYTHLWVYWIGPCTGGLSAALLYQGVFRASL